MILRVKMIGTGTNRDPYRVPLPTYQCLVADYDAGFMVVDIPDDDVPAGLPAPAPSEITSVDITADIATTDDVGKTTVETQTVDTVDARTNVSTKFLASWYDHLDAKYAEHAGEFRHEVV